MRYLIIFILAFSFTINSQTKEETIEWLNTKLATYGTNTNMLGQMQIRIEHDEKYGEYLVFTNKLFFIDKNIFTTYTFEANAISNIVLSGKNRTNNTLDIFIISKNNNIFLLDDKKFISEFVLYMRNGYNDEAIKIQKGLLHLLKLMGNKIEPQKELFND